MRMMMLLQFVISAHNGLRLQLHFSPGTAFSETQSHSWCKTSGELRRLNNGPYTNNGNDTEVAMASAVVVVQRRHRHPDGGDAHGQHAPVGGKHQPDGIVITIEATGLGQEIDDDPNDQQNCN